MAERWAAALLPGLMPWDLERLSPFELDALFAGSLWRREREWEQAMTAAVIVASSQGAKVDLANLLGHEPGTSRVPGYGEE